LKTATIAATATRETTMFIATNVYGWSQIATREGRDYDRLQAMESARAAGFTGWEDAYGDVEKAKAVAEDARESGLEMRSAYVFGAFHTPDLAASATKTALSICDALMPHGVTHFIFNPDPLPNGALKDDAALRVQSASLEALGRTLKDRGARLLYHTHDPEMRASAREFHHMLCATDPDAVSLCLDTHWIWRGAGNSMVALEDIVRLYAPRVAELHLRQSHGGVWAETLGEGDIDHDSVRRLLEADGRKRLIVIEHAYEGGTPNERDVVEAHAESVAFAKAQFGGMAA
jgi:inosose dehydratase